MTKKRQNKPKHPKETNFADTSDEETNNRGKGCSHVAKGVNLGRIKKSLKSVQNILSCSGCPVDTDHDSQEVWLCLQCGYRGCGRTSEKKHGLQHFKTIHSDCHSLVMSTISGVVWCYDCDTDINLQVSRNLKQCVEFLLKMIPKFEPKNTPMNKNRLENISSVDEDKNSSEKMSNLKEQKSTKNNKDASTNAPKGLRNLGNTCFFNAVMQNLSQSALFVHELMNICSPTYVLNVPALSLFENDIKIKKDELINLNLPKHFPLTNSLLKFFEQMSATTMVKNEVINPNSLFTEISKKCPQFRHFQEQDSHELLRQLLDGIRQEEIKRQKKGILRYFDLETVSPENVDDETKKLMKAYGLYASHTIVERVFGGLLISTVLCEECKTASQVFEPFMDLSLPLFEEKQQESNEQVYAMLDGGKQDNNKPLRNKKTDWNVEEDDGEYTIRKPEKSEPAKLSKHQEKKLRQLARKNKKGNKNARNEKNSGGVLHEDHDSSVPEANSFIKNEHTSKVADEDIDENKINNGVHEKDEDKSKNNTLNEDVDISENTYVPDEDVDKSENTYVLDEDVNKSKINNDDMNVNETNDVLDEDVNKSKNNALNGDVNINEMNDDALVEDVNKIKNNVLNGDVHKNETNDVLVEDVNKSKNNVLNGDVHKSETTDDVVKMNKSEIGTLNEGMGKNETNDLNEDVDKNENVLHDVAVNENNSDTLNKNANCYSDYIYSVDNEHEVTKNSGNNDRSLIEHKAEDQSEKTNNLSEHNLSEELSDHMNRLFISASNREDKSESTEFFGPNLDHAPEEIKKDNKTEASSEQLLSNPDEFSSCKFYNVNIENIVNKRDVKFEENVHTKENIKSGDEDIEKSNDTDILHKESNGEFCEMNVNVNVNIGNELLDINKLSICDDSPLGKDLNDKMDLLTEVPNKHFSSALSEPACENFKTAEVENHDSLFNSTESDNCETSKSAHTSSKSSIEESFLCDHNENNTNSALELDEKTQEWISKSLTTLKPRYQVSSLECSVNSCLSHFTKPELLTGTNKFRCSRCTDLKIKESGNKKDVVYTNASKQLLIFSPPAVLTLHLKRFQQVGMSLRKVNRFVEFPLILDLAPFCNSACSMLPHMSSVENEVLYSLYGVVEHSGRLTSGHYTAYVKTCKRTINREFECSLPLQTCNLEQFMHRFSGVSSSLDNVSSEPNNKDARWFYISDAFVKEVSEAQVLKCQAYLLFYERIK